MLMTVSFYRMKLSCTDVINIKRIQPISVEIDLWDLGDLCDIKL